jgi:Zn-dependent protease with chaperone function
LISTAPTIVAVETDSAWVVILAVSVVLLPVTFLLRKVINRPGGLGSAALMGLPLVLPLIAAALYQGGVLPEIGVLTPLSAAVLDSSTGVLPHVLMLSDGRPGVGIPYVLDGSTGQILLLIGITTSTFMLLRRAAGVVALRRLLRRCAPLGEHEDDWLRDLVHDLAEDAGVKPPEVLILPSGLSGAFATGGRLKRVLISRDLIEVLERDELQGILAHEIAHIANRDIPIVFTAGLFRDLVAWNPMAHLAFHVLVTDRECEADRRAAAATGEPLAVASSLVKVCDLMRGNRGFRTRMALAFLRPRSRLKRRVDNLLALADGVASPNPLGLLPFLMAACLACVVGLQVGAKLAAQADAGGLAIVLGAPDSSEVWKADPAPKYFGKAKKQEGKGAKKAQWVGNVSLWPSDLAVRQQDFPKFMRALTTWAKRHHLPPRRFVQPTTRSWRAVPLLGGPGILSLYRIDPLGRLASAAGDP